jgi:hypothetical protein
MDFWDFVIPCLLDCGGKPMWENFDRLYAECEIEEFQCKECGESFCTNALTQLNTEYRIEYNHDVPVCPSCKCVGTLSGC